VRLLLLEAIVATTNKLLAVVLGRLLGLVGGRFAAFSVSRDS
jgi:hypothetical protein